MATREESEQSAQNRTFGRVFIPDERDNKFPMFRMASQRISRYWNCEGWWGDQQAYPYCTGYAAVHWLEDGPVTHAGKAPVVDPVYVYKEAQKIDEWPDDVPYEGTSVRAAVKVLRTLGYVSSFRWTNDVLTLANVVLTQGPVIVGTNWYAGMMVPDEKTGFIRVTGELYGGHAYVLNGVNLNQRKFRMKNSWGRKWGKKGAAFLSFDDVDRLLREDGEACLAIEVKPQLKDYSLT